MLIADISNVRSSLCNSIQCNSTPWRHRWTSQSGSSSSPSHQLSTCISRHRHLLRQAQRHAVGGLHPRVYKAPLVAAQRRACWVLHWRRSWNRKRSADCCRHYWFVHQRQIEECVDFFVLRSLCRCDPRFTRPWCPHSCVEQSSKFRQSDNNADRRSYVRVRFLFCFFVFVDWFTDYLSRIEFTVERLINIIGHTKHFLLLLFLPWFFALLHTAVNGTLSSS